MTTDPVDAEARAAAVFATGSVLVQAPAGSGKTTLLAQRYLRLLAGVDAPERILALTFTRRAAQEMRERVLQALAAAAVDHCPPRMHPQTWELGRAAQRRMAELGLDLERHPSRLRIETMDAFNAWLAGQLPITAGAGARLNLTEAPLPLYEEAAQRALAHDATDQFAPAVEQVLALGDQRWRSLVKLIADLLPTRDRWLPLLAGRIHATRALDDQQLRAVRRHLDEDLALLVTRVLKTADAVVGAQRLSVLSGLLHGAARRLVGAVPETHDLAAWQADGSTLRAEPADAARWRGVAATLLTQDDAYRKRLTKNEGFPPHCADKQAMASLIEELGRDPAVLNVLVEIRRLPAPAYDDAQWERVRAVAQVLVLAAACLEQLFRERGTADFPAVSMAAVRALGSASSPTDLNLRLDYRLQHVLVDEFQDTSSAQLELIKLLTAGWQRGDGRSVFCVGDPMQSIYGFRQAEVRAFLELAQEGIGDVQFQVERLGSNFRSSKPVVDWINACFAAILPRRDDRERGAIAYRPSESTLAGAELAGAAPAVVLQGYATRRAEAAAIAARIATQTALHPDWRIAVLVRARTHAREIALALRARAVPFRAVDIEPLVDRPVVRDLVALIRALLHPGDRTAWLAVLRAPWAGLTLADLLHVARGASMPWQALADDALLAGLSDDGRSRCERVRRTLDAAYAVRTQSGVARWVERTWLAMGGPQCAPNDEELAHAAQVFARLRELEESGLPDAADLAAGFGDLYAVYGGAAAVEIMTIHKAKGLEFDMVMVPALDRHTPSNRDSLLLSHQFARAGRDGLVMAARPAIGAERDAVFDFLRARARDAAGLEAERLLYVACTRTKWQLHLSATVGSHVDTEPAPDTARPWTPRTGSLLAVLWPVASRDFVPGEAAYQEPAQEPMPAAPRGGPLRRVPRNWEPAVADVLGATDPVPPPAARDATPVFDWAGETARRVGSLVHAELHRMELPHDAAAAIHGAAAIMARAAHYRRWLAVHGVPDERLPAAGARVVAALLAVQRDPRARWILQRRAREDFREYAVSGRWQGSVVRAVFDRSFVDGGLRWVIDYKTSEHTGGNLDEFLDREVERYRPQLLRYARLAAKQGPEPVRAGLYFPLMRAWREWLP